VNKSLSGKLHLCIGHGSGTVGIEAVFGGRRRGATLKRASRGSNMQLWGTEDVADGHRDGGSWTVGWLPTHRPTEV
jgi:hypothetical protein